MLLKTLQNYNKTRCNTLSYKRQKCSNSTIMVKQAKNLSLNAIKLLAEEEKKYYIDDDIYIAMNASDFGKKNLRYGQPYQLNEGRVMIVSQGWVKVSINMVEHVLERHMVVVLVTNSVFEIEAWSDDFDMQAFSFKDLPIVATSLNHHFVTSLNEQEWQLCSSYLNLLWQAVHLPPLRLDAIRHLQTSFLLEAQQIAQCKEAVRQKSITRKDTTFQHFIQLVNQHGMKERKIEFYANSLCITPNYLGSLIKQASGLTVMQWLNRYAIQQSKIMLKYSDMPIGEIAEHLNFANPSFFAKFFKHETGLTPKAFREM